MEPGEVFILSNRVEDTGKNGEGAKGDGDHLAARLMKPHVELVHKLAHWDARNPARDAAREAVTAAIA